MRRGKQKTRRRSGEKKTKRSREDENTGNIFKEYKVFDILVSNPTFGHFLVIQLWRFNYCSTVSSIKSVRFLTKRKPTQLKAHQTRFLYCFHSDVASIIEHFGSWLWPTP